MGRIGAISGTGTTRSTETVGTVDDEQTTPMGRPSPQPTSQLQTQEDPRATPTAESKETAQARFINDPRAKNLQHALQGNADVVGGKDKSSATNVGALPGPRPASSDFKTVADATTALEKDFGVHVVAGAWSAEELSRVHEAWSQLTPGERANLKGLDLKRDGQAPADVSAANKGSGQVAGLYEPNVEADANGRKAAPSITYYDAAFPKPENTPESRRSSMHVILHEAGHAVEKRAYDDAMAASNAAVEKLNPIVGEEKQANADLKAAQAPLNKGLHAEKTPAHIKEGKAFVAADNAMRAAEGQLDAAKTPAQLAKANAAMDKAVAQLDAATAGMSADNPAASAVQTYADARKARADVGRRYGDASVGYETAHAQEAALGAKGNTKTIADFSKSIKGDKPVSGYGGTAPDENFAEAFALYRRDPATLQANNPKTYAWFAKHYP